MIVHVYYAHPISLYNTLQEKQDLQTLAAICYKIVNPNHPDIEKKYIDSGKDWKIFDDLVLGCEALAYRTLPDGRITSGVWKEIQLALANNIAVIKLPNLESEVVMTKDETLQHLKEMGLR